MSYSLLFEPYGWVIGTAVWIDSIEDLKATYDAESHRQMKTSIYQLASFIAVLIALLIVFAIYIGNKISAPIIKITDEIERMATGDFTTKNRESGNAVKDKTEISQRI